MVATGFVLHMAEQKKQEVRVMKNKALGFSIAGSILIILFMLFINYTTSPGFPWFIYPVFAALWWPIGVYTAKKGGGAFIAIAGPVLSIAFFAAVNLTTSPGFLWFIFPVFGILWWPLGYFLGRRIKAFTVIGSLLLIAFFFLVNLMTGFGHPWFIYPVFGVIWWPLAVFFGKGRAKLFSVLGFLLSAAFFVIVNLVTSPGHPWFIYPVFGAIWWPLAIFFGKSRPKLFSILGFLLISGFFVIVNLITSPGHLWFIHPVFATAWWPLSLLLAKKTTIKGYSLTAAIMTIAYLVFVNILVSPGVWWCLYALFPLLLWPALMYMEKLAASLPVAVIGSLAGITYYLMLNIFMSPGHPWILYLALPLVWWPVVIAFKKVAANLGFLFVSITIFIVYYGLLNIFISPGHPWSLYLIYPYAWAVIGMYYGRRRKAFALSVAATIITAAFMSVINLIYTPGTIWAIFPVFAIMWWPLSLYFFKVRGKRRNA